MNLILSVSSLFAFKQGEPLNDPSEAELNPEGIAPLQVSEQQITELKALLPREAWLAIKGGEEVDYVKSAGLRQVQSLFARMLLIAGAVEAADSPYDAIPSWLQARLRWLRNRVVDSDDQPVLERQVDAEIEQARQSAWVEEMRHCVREGEQEADSRDDHILPVPMFHPDYPSYFVSLISEWPEETSKAHLTIHFQNRLDETGLRYLERIINKAIDNATKVERRHYKQIKAWIKQQIERLSSEPTTVLISHTSPATTLVFASRRGKASYTWEDVDQLAEEIGLLKQGKCELGARKQGAVLGFAEALAEAGWLDQTESRVLVSTLQEEFGMRYYGKAITTDRVTSNREKYRVQTVQKLKLQGRYHPTN